jgi:hypothetical protein
MNAIVARVIPRQLRMLPALLAGLLSRRKSVRAARACLKHIATPSKIRQRMNERDPRLDAVLPRDR